jgi:hypothetical protein
MTQEKRLNVARLVRDLGGARAVASATGVVRTAPYRWIARNYIGSPTLEQIKTAFPLIDLNQYFENVEGNT